MGFKHYEIKILTRAFLQVSVVPLETVGERRFRNLRTPKRKQAVASENEVTRVRYLNSERSKRKLSIHNCNLNSKAVSYAQRRSRIQLLINDNFRVHDPT